MVAWGVDAPHDALIRGVQAPRIECGDVRSSPGRGRCALTVSHAAVMVPLAVPAPPPDSDETLSDEDRKRIVAYESAATRLEATLADYERRRIYYIRFFAGLMIAGFACFAFGLLVGVWGSFSACLISFGGYGLLRARFWELRTEIAEMHEEAARVRNGASGSRR